MTEGYYRTHRTAKARPNPLLCGSWLRCWDTERLITVTMF